MKAWNAWDICSMLSGAEVIGTPTTFPAPFPGTFAVGAVPGPVFPLE